MKLGSLATTLVLLGALSSALRAQGTAQEDPEATSDGRRSYLGRDVARTMHWKGAEWLLRETREDEENAALLLESLGIQPGDTVCDLGCGNGYYTLPFAERAGASGKVYAVDIQEEMLRMLAGRVEESGLGNIETVLGTLSDPRLPAESCDLIVMIDVYHEISHPVTVLSHLRKALKPTGRLLLVEFRLEDPGVPIKPRHKMTKAQVLLELGANGFEFAEEFDELPWQHVLGFQKQAPESEAGAVTGAVTGVVKGARSGRAVSRGLWRALGKADVLSLRGFYAEDVQVLAGSEFLKPEWSERDGDGRPGSRDKTQRIEREAWLTRYRRGLEAIGTERWRSVFAKLEPSLRAARVDDWSGATPADLYIGAGSTDENLYWILRQNRVGQWLVVAERTDF